MASLTDPGGPFAVIEEPVLGQPVSVFEHRPPNVRTVLADAAERHPDRPHIVCEEQTLSYSDTLASMARVAALLEQHGVTKGSRVAFAAANHLPYPVAWWATLSLGAVVASLNGWWTAIELAHGIELSAPTVLFADERRLERLAEVVVGLDPELVVLDLAVLEPLLGPARPDDPALPDVAIDEDDPAIILFTSGTTGRPKGATLSHRSLVHAPMVGALQAAMGARANELMGVEPDPNGPRQPSTLLAAPLFHVSGALPLVSAPVMGTRLVFPPVGQWDEITHLRLTEQHHVGGWTGVPAQFWRLLEHPRFDEFDTSSVIQVGGGGAVFTPDLFRLMAEKLPQARVGAGYGMSETFGSAARLGGLTLETHPASVGTVEPLCELEIRDPAGTVLDDDEVGEICIRGASVFLGYWGDDEATAEALDEHRWYRTGDYGRFTDGVLQLESRMRDLIIRGGENIYPIEIENRLAEHPAVAEACVVGVPHHQLGQEVAAVLVLHPDATLEPQEVQTWAAESLATYKVPAYVLFRDELPYNATGKVVKRDVEDEVREALA